MKKGFTLIELLIVIAIIGILASVVVVSLGDQTGKASIAKIEAEITQVSTIATAHFSNNENSYESLCKEAAAAAGTTAAINSPTLFAIVASLEAINDGTPVNVSCLDSATAWAFAYHPLGVVTSDNVAYCVDSVNGLKKYGEKVPVYSPTNTLNVLGMAGTADAPACVPITT